MGRLASLEEKAHAWLCRQDTLLLQLSHSIAMTMSFKKAAQHRWAAFLNDKPEAATPLDS